MRIKNETKIVLDEFRDRIPGISSISNLIMFAKQRKLAHKLKHDPLPDNPLNAYEIHVLNKNKIRMIALIVLPFVGNFGVLIYDAIQCYKKPIDERIRIVSVNLDLSSPTSVDKLSPEEGAVALKTIYNAYVNSRTNVSFILPDDFDVHTLRDLSDLFTNMNLHFKSGLKSGNLDASFYIEAAQKVMVCCGCVIP